MSSRTRVVHIADKLGVGGSSIHGVTRLFSWWMPRFDSENYDVSLTILREPDHAYEHLQGLGIQMSSLSKGKFDLTTTSAIYKLLKDEKADIAHLHGYGATNFGIPAARLANIPCIEHEHFVDPNIPFYQIPFDFFLGRFVSNGIAVSQSVSEFMVKSRFVPRARVSVIYNGAPLSEFSAAEDTEVALEKAKWGISSEEFVVTTVGRMDEQKGITYLIDAMPSILDKHPNVRFLIVGDGPLLDDFKEKTEKLGVSDQVTFTGFHSDIPLIQSLTDIQVFPSLWEGTPLTVFEAMAMKLPIVSTNVDGLGEVLQDGKNALVVEPKNPSALASATSRILSDETLRESLVQASYDSSQVFDISNTVRSMERIYDSLVKRQ